jgi:CHAD domain-containing protein
MAADRHLELERKYTVDDEAVVPLGTGEAEPRWGEPAEQRLEAVYFDTADLDLARRGITLRRRTGGDDEGWHVKLPAIGDARTELRQPLGRAVRSVPAKVVDPVRAVVRDRPLVPVASISSHRTVYTLVGDDGPVAMLCDDRVTARALVQAAEPLTWREWEVEVVEGQPESVLDSLEPVLQLAGARRAKTASKLQRILDVAPAAPAADDDGSGGRRVQDVLRRRLRDQVAELHEQDAAIRGDEARAVHRMRIAARRLRSALVTCGPVLRDAHEDVRAELRWLGQVLGQVRDVQVMRDRIRAQLDDLPHDLVLGPVPRRLAVEMHRREKDGLATLREALDSPRYFRLLDALDGLVADAGVAPSGARARDVLRDLVRRDAKRLRRAVDAVEEATIEDHDAALHEARKKAKRLRYAAELAEMGGWRRGSKVARRAKRVQQALGEHQDTVVAQETLRELGALSFLNGENGFTFGLLHGREGLHAQDAERRFRKAWAKLS